MKYEIKKYFEEKNIEAFVKNQLNSSSSKKKPTG